MLQRPKVPKELEIVKWLELQTKALFLIRLQVVDRKFEKVDHVVTVHIGTRMVWDFAEKLVMSLMVGAFKVCLKNGFAFILIRKIENIREAKTPEKKEEVS